MVSFILKNFVKNVLTLLVQFAIPVLFMNIMLSYVEYGSILYYLCKEDGRMKGHKLLTAAVIIYVVVSLVNTLHLIKMNDMLTRQNIQMRDHISELSRQIVQIQENMIELGHPELVNVNNDKEEDD